MRSKLVRVIVALVIASSLIIAGTAHAGAGEPGLRPVTLSSGS